MKSVLISIRPKWCDLIASGKKTIEVRKTRPKIKTPFKCYIYCTKPSKKYQTISGCMVLNDDELFKIPNGKIKYGNSIEMIAYDNYTADNFLNGKVIGEFVCDRIDIIDVIDDGIMTYIRVNQKADMFITQETCLKINGLQRYLDGKSGYGWHISDLKIYDEPKELGEFHHCGEGYHFNPAVTKPPQSWCYVEELQR